ncbi:MAG: FAD-dependent oxidoreductase [Furfurilactobacillus sp.]|uniref:FAD-dependent oxidoreductase n=1 Tax=Furfurilactobacillus milii TaxID=2888272 RepID=A0ABT6DAW1_9LACO|nr:MULTISPECIES: FAD-dependent oxidoreductase [Furfurilactobacillus]QLE67548.1 Fumarate reductase flavoprotein subunit [Furfurilactobacillus rossiae]MCF6161396.1 FAD-dependent oxidoreductase [Furfurilactobacillus milii]MCF6163776.1 FAD-dependent oxidoreductase [Furfurilactobacillus milii]MCF6419546.1 FAD-dependent oxidoreductase [Furfurilactobacillus milii]MCH4011678.1 FAD-dependent oxidoreductase [Furfurilactobacillus sp.]
MPNITKKDAYDVVVVGTGAAGTSAALTAAQNGASVLLLEKGRHTGGSSNYTEGLFAVDSYLQKQQGITVSGTDVLKEEVAYSKYRADSRIWRNYVDDSADTVKWLNEQGVEYEGVQAMGDGEATWHIYKGMGNAVINDALIPQAKKLGVEVLTSTAATNIDQGNGEIFRVIIKDLANNRSETVKTTSVILATGGYLNNAEMMSKMTHYDTSRLVTVSSGKGTGDGLQMAWNLGARKYGTGTAMLFGGYLKDPSVPAFKFMSSEMNTAAGQQPLLWVNENGERFVDESVVYNFSFAGNALYTQNKVFSILDTAVIDEMAKSGNFMGLGVYVKRGQKMTKLKDEIDESVADGRPFIFKADTIEELAQKMNIPADQLMKTTTQYNHDCESGQDSLFGKDPKYMLPINEGPFYGFSLNVGAFCTMGGLQVNPNNEVLDNNGQAIAGLYAIGNDATGLVGDTYGPNMPGTCVGYAFYSGRNAGLHAAMTVNDELEGN